MHLIGICNAYENDQLPQDIKNDDNWQGLSGSRPRFTVFSQKMNNDQADSNMVETVCAGLIGNHGETYLFRTKDGRPFAVACKH